MNRVVVLSLSLPVMGCGATSPSPKAAIQKVYEADKQLALDRDKLPPNCKPSQIAWAVGRYCDGLEKLNMAD